jgi:hypothetical protein
VCFLFLVFDSCIEPFTVTLSGDRGYVVIDGLITDQPGPHTIKLFRPSALNDQLTAVDWIKGASLTLHDDLGNTTKLTEHSAGNYETDSSFRGTPGNTYTLQVSISDREQYESVPQKLLPVGKISKIYYEFVQVQDTLTANQVKVPRNGFNIFLDGNILPEQNKLVRWRTMATYEIITFPVNRRVPVESKDVPPPVKWDPPPCSGIQAYPFIRTLGPCTCCNCWLFVYDEKPLLSEAKFVNGNEVTRQKLAFVPARRDYLTTKYYLKVDQMSVTPEAYEYWLNIKKQGGTGNDLFQTPAARTISNMRAVGDTQTPIIGLFGVSSIQSVSLSIDRSAVPYRLWDPDRYEDSCLNLAAKDITNKKPAYWN